MPKFIALALFYNVEEDTYYYMTIMVNNMLGRLPNNYDDIMMLINIINDTDEPFPNNSVCVDVDEIITIPGGMTLWGSNESVEIWREDITPLVNKEVAQDEYRD